MQTTSTGRSDPEWGGLSDSVREYVREHYLEPALSRGQVTVRVVAGDVHRGLGLTGRVPSVCSALKKQSFLAANGLRLEKVEGPPSKQSTTVVYTYSFTSGAPKRTHPFWSLRGAAKDVFREIGGGEAFLAAERKSFFGAAQGETEPRP